MHHNILSTWVSQIYPPLVTATTLNTTLQSWISNNQGTGNIRSTARVFGGTSTAFEGGCRRERPVRGCDVSLRAVFCFGDSELNWLIWCWQWSAQPCVVHVLVAKWDMEGLTGTWQSKIDDWNMYLLSGDHSRPGMWDRLRDMWRMSTSCNLPCDFSGDNAAGNDVFSYSIWDQGALKLRMCSDFVFELEMSGWVFATALKQTLLTATRKSESMQDKFLWCAWLGLVH